MTDEEKLKGIIGKENPFKVPDGYFEDFQQRLMSSLPERSFAQKKPVRIPIWKNTRAWVSAAAVFAGVIIMVAALHRADNLRDAAYASTDDGIFTEEEMSEYLATSVFDDYTLYSYLTNDE